MGDEKKILLVEVNPYHEECLYSQCLMAKHLGRDVMVVANSKSRERVKPFLREIVNEIIFMPFGSGFKGTKALLRLYLLILSLKDVHVHFNTAQGNVVWKLFLLPFPKRTHVTGTIHNVEKLRKSIGQKIINRQIRGYMLLSDLLLPEYKVSCKRYASVVYLVFYPRVDTIQIEKPQGEIWIVIPGAVSLNRRDFMSLFTSNAIYPSNVKIILLGNINKGDGLLVKKVIHEKGLEQSFKTFENYVPDSTFYAYVEACDYIMPLVHPSKPKYAKYVSTKISGTYNLAIAYRKPMLCPLEMSGYEDFDDTSIFYDEKDIAKLFSSLKNISSKGFFTLPKWSLDYQAVQFKQLT